MPQSAQTNTAPERGQTFSIKDLAEAFDVTARTLRHYEAEGLLHPERSGQTRIYSEADRTRLSWILRGRRVGFSLAEIAEMLALYNIGDGRETQRQVTLDKCRDRIDALTAQKADIETTIKELTDFVSLLSRLEFSDEAGRWVDPATGKLARHYLNEADASKPYQHHS